MKAVTIWTVSGLAAMASAAIMAAAINTLEATSRGLVDTPPKQDKLIVDRIPPVAVRRVSPSETIGNHTIIYKLEDLNAY